MTRLKAQWLGSAVAIVAFASARAADLPTDRTAPATAYIKVCTVGGVTGFVLPGSETCVKVSGYLTAEYAAGAPKDRFGLTNTTSKGAPAVTEVEDLPARRQPLTGYTTRGEVDFDAISNTDYGPLLAHIELQGISGSGFEAPGNGVVINNAYLAWAGLTAGRHWSFYYFFTGGPPWKDFFAPDDSGMLTNLIAYTAPFGGGVGATLSLEQPLATNGFAGQEENGDRSPDIVAALDARHGWGVLHLAGVGHLNEVATTAPGTLAQYGKWGYGVVGGLIFAIPGLPGDDIAFQASFTHAAIGYSGVPNAVWGQGNPDINVNTIGTLFSYGDAYWTGSRWSTPDAWTMATFADIHAGENFVITPKLSYGAVTYSGDAPLISKSAAALVGGAVLDWSPIHNLDFAFELLYETSRQSRPTAYIGPPFVGDASGFNGRLRINRSF